MAGHHPPFGLRTIASVALLSLTGLHATATRVETRPEESLLASHLLVTWYGNPHSAAMGVLGQAAGDARADALRRQAACYVPLTPKQVLPAFHLVAIVAQKTAGADGRWRRRESHALMMALLAEARSYGFALVLDVQPGRSTVADEIDYLLPLLVEPDVHLALDPEFAMGPGQRPGTEIGRLPASEINAALDALQRLRLRRALPPKVLIVHQFTIGMLPDKPAIRNRDGIDLVLDMDGFGPQPLKRASYGAVNRQFRLPFAGFKLFYRQDTNVFDPAGVLQLDPVPSVVIYQ